MTFIRIQNAKINDNGVIIGGSASIVESVYQKGSKVPCKQVKKEGLGTIVYMENRRAGIFLSKTRGLVYYDAERDEFSQVSKDDPRLKEAGKEHEIRVRTLFGDCDLLLRFLNSKGILRILQNVAVATGVPFDKMVFHTLHGVLRDGCRITCDRFIERSFVSNLSSTPASILRTDTEYYEKLGIFEVRLEFFRLFIKEMRLRNPVFGKGCYVDSTPLPNSISDLPTNSMCSQDLDSVGVQTRLVLILDISTGLPVWFDIIPGNVLDLSTIMCEIDKVSHILDVKVDDMVLDAGYVCKSIIETYNLDDNTDKTLLARMPAKKGYNMEVLFTDTLKLFSQAKYGFIRQGHTYVGIRKEVELFGKREYAYIYLDNENAQRYYQGYMIKHSEEYQKMTNKEKNWTRYRGGFFVLVSNIESEPVEILDRYYGRTEIETVFNCGKEYLGMLPLNKHSEDTVCGKILQDIITLIVYLEIRKMTVPTGRSVTDYICDLQSLDCYRTDENTLMISVPNRQAKAAYELFGFEVPSTIKLDEYGSTMYFQI